MDLLYQRIGGSEGLSRLLRHFYADVRQDPLIGPIFNSQIKDWKHHLEFIASFWETIVGGPRPMPVKHLTLRPREEDFERWLFSLAGKMSCSTVQRCGERNDRLSESHRAPTSHDSWQPPCVRLPEHFLHIRSQRPRKFCGENGGSDKRIVTASLHCVSTRNTLNRVLRWSNSAFPSPV